MPFLFEELTFAPERVKDVEVTISISLLCLSCPVCAKTCFPDLKALEEHMKTEHPLEFWFWYWTYDEIPAGKILLGGSILTGLLLIIAAATRKPKPKKV